MTANKFRIEADTLGEVRIPAQALWGPQTERSRHNFPTGKTMPLSMIRALLQIKKAAAQVNCQLENLEQAKATLIIQAVDQLLNLPAEKLQQDFPLHVYQTGSGTQTNMNVNEVVAHQAAQLGSQITILPNDDVNRGQSSNDVFPTVMNITVALVTQKLTTELKHLIAELKVKQAK